jgi:hypothetical protein
MYQHIWICQPWIFEIEGSHLYFQKAKKTQAGACAVQGRRNGFFYRLRLSRK